MKRFCSFRGINLANLASVLSIESIMILFGNWFEDLFKRPALNIPKQIEGWLISSKR